MTAGIDGGTMRAIYAAIFAVMLTLVAVGVSVAADDPGSPPAGSGAAMPAPPPPAAKPASPPPSITVIGAADAHGVLGRDVKSSTGENMGRIVDIIADKSGAVRAAVIDFGGFLGVGSRKIAVDWNALHFGQVQGKNSSITLELTQDQVKAAPEYKEGTPVVVLGASGSLNPLRF
jgi:hypothetical protein